MNRQWTITVLFLLAFGLGCLEWLSAATTDPPRITAGFNGHVKSDHWFPVWIEPAPAYTLQSIDVMQQGYGKDPATVLSIYGADQDLETGGWRALAWLPRYHRSEPFLRCRFLSDTGQSEHVDVPLRILSPEDLLVIVISDRPEAFQFLGNIEHGRQRTTRSVAGGPEILRGLRWQDLQAVDVIVLDGPPPLHHDDRRALRHWIIMGGTMIATDRAMQNDGTWGFLPAPPPDIATHQNAATGEETAALLADRAPDVLSIPLVNIIPESFVPLVTTHSGTLVGGKNLGQGRILACAIDWTGMELRDHTRYESTRRTLWSGLFSLRPPGGVSELSSRPAIPREARIRFVMGPLLWFLLGCCILLGPVNWLILKWCRRREYMILTLPVGAMVLAVAALVAGHAWRPRETLINEILVTRNNGGAAWTSAISGILSPAYRQYAVATPDREILLRNVPSPGNVVYSTDKKTAALMTTLGKDGMRIDNVLIARWAVGFFATQRPDNDENGLQAEGRLTATNRISGTVSNQTPHSFRDVWVISHADRTFLGTIEPGTRHAFDLTLTDPKDHTGRKCSGCGRYHLRADPFEDREDEPPIPPVMKELGSRQLTGRYDDPYVIGRTDTETHFLHVMEADKPSRRRTENIIVAPITMQWTETSPAPDRFIHRLIVPEIYDANAWGSRLQRLPLHYLPHGLAAKAAFQTSETTTDDDLKPWLLRPIFFALPTLHDSSVIHIEWDRKAAANGKPPDEKVTLEAFDWAHDRWFALATVTNGTRHIRMTGADSTVLPSTPGLALRERLQELSVALPTTRGRARQGTLTVEILHGDNVNDR